MTIMKRTVIYVLMLLIAGSGCMYGQENDEKLMDEGLAMNRMLEETKGDSLKYAHALFSFAKYCRTLGLFEHSLVSAGTSSTILEKYKKKATTFEEKYPRNLDMIHVNNFIIDLMSGRKPDLYGVAMMPDLNSMICSLEITTECLDKIGKAIEIGDSIAIKKTQEYMKTIPDNSVSISAALWQNADIKKALEVVTQALESTSSQLTVAHANILQKRKKALTLLQNASRKDIDMCLQMADSLYNPITLSQILYDQRLPDNYHMLRRTAQLYKQYKKPQEALAVYKRIISLIIQQMKDDLPYLLPYEKGSLCGFMESYFDEMQQFACDYPNMTGSAEFLYNVTSLKKELFELTSFNYNTYASKYKDKYIDALIAKKDSLVKDENTYKTSLNGDYICGLKNAVQIANLEKIIVERLKRKNNDPHEWYCQWSDIVTKLSPQEAVVDIINLQRPGEWAIDSDYWAIIFKGGDGSSQLIPICPASEFATHFYSDKAYKKIWEAIDQKIEGCLDVYIAYEGYLNQYSFAEIKVGESYLCDKYNLHDLMSTKDILSIKSAPPTNISPRDIIFFGGAQFGLPLAETMESHRGQGFAFLPGTVKEVNEICKLLPKDKWRIHKHMGKAATEKALKRLSDKPLSSGILHVSTHGFNLRYDESISNRSIQTNGKSGFYDPLLRTGFVLTGANEAWTDKRPVDGTDDGIVTAFEIGALNLKNIELVVLSACGTGLGSIRGGQGFIGMSRALRMAGVRYMLVTLSDVSDEYTAKFMIHFYNQLQEIGNVSQAFIRTQRWMKEADKDSFFNKWAHFKLIE